MTEGLSRDLPSKQNRETNAHPAQGYWDLNKLLKDRGTLPGDPIERRVDAGGQGSRGNDLNALDLAQNTRPQSVAKSFRSIFSRT